MGRRGAKRHLFLVGGGRVATHVKSAQHDQSISKEKRRAKTRGPNQVWCPYTINGVLYTPFVSH